MSSPSPSNLKASLAQAVPGLRGRLEADYPLKDISWFRTGGPAEVLFTPEDTADLARFFAHLPPDVPWTIIGLGSNLLVRDGGVPGVVIRLGRGFFGLSVEDGFRIRVGAGVPDVKLARFAADAGLAGLAFYRGIPGAVGGALRMNAGAYGGETKDVVVEATIVTRTGEIRTLANAELGFRYRGASWPQDAVAVEAVMQGRPGDAVEITAAMDAITQARSSSQPINARTGGSTFKNPPGHKAWQLIDAAGCRGLVIGDAQVSELHCNFLVNRGNATAHDIEALGETVRRRVWETSGVDLDWEIKRIGIPASPD